jgi:protein-S-isoprenylcysteine O-methyltransferase Ste14
MKALHYAVAAVWVAFWVYWFASARGVKPTLAGRHAVRARLAIWVAAVVVVHVWHPHALVIHSVALGALGLVIVLAGLAIAVWARRYLGRNWGMPMSIKQDPELVTSGPYAWVRHPIYSGLLLAFAGTVLLTSAISILLVIAFGVSFTYSAVVEERNMTNVFPEDYPAYQERTKMLIPFVL